MVAVLKGKKRQTHIKIMHNAKSLFEKKGLYNVTIEEISEASGICRSTFFNHFNSMDELLVSIASQEIDDLLAQCSGEERGVKVIIKIMEKLVDDTVPYPYLMMQLMMSIILKQDEDNKSLKSIQDVIKENLKYEPLNKNYSVNEATSLILGVYFGTVFSCFISNKKIDGEAIKDTLLKSLSELLLSNNL